MITKGSNPLEALGERSLAPLLKAYFELNHLKQLYRQGWLRRGVPIERAESVAEHVFSMAMLAWWIADAHFPQLDRDRVIRMVLAHELGEIYAGDITPGDNMPAEEKHRLERASLLRVIEPLPNAAELLALWEEFEAAETPEAIFVKQIDRLEMAFQAAVYEHQGFGSMEEFFATTDQAVIDPILRGIFEALNEARPS